MIRFFLIKGCLLIFSVCNGMLFKGLDGDRINRLFFDVNLSKFLIKLFIFLSSWFLVFFVSGGVVILGYVRVLVI